MRDYLAADKDDFELEESSLVAPFLPDAENVDPIELDASSHADSRRPGRFRQCLRSLFASTPETHGRHNSDTAWLDGLRGCASLLVVFVHWQGYAGFDGGPVYGARSVEPDSTESFEEWYRLPCFRWIYSSADAAVSIFFIISGFVLTRKSLHLMRQRRYDEFIKTLSSTVFRRIIRLWIPSTLASLSGLVVIQLRYREKYFYPQPEDHSILSELLLWALESIRLLNPYSFFQSEFVIYRSEYT